jgi:uncharacterized membrane protein YkvA (DUF1232 family)
LARHYIFLAISVIYLLNPSAGIWEIIPDNIPIIGNLDEVAAVLIGLDALKSIRKNKKNKSKVKK